MRFGDVMGWVLVIGVFGVLIGIRHLWGSNAKRMAHDRGIKENYYWWGFVFGAVVSLLLWMRPRIPDPVYKPIKKENFKL